LLRFLCSKESKSQSNQLRFVAAVLFVQRVFILFFGGKEKYAKESRREKKLPFSRLVLLWDDSATALPG